MGNQYHNLAEGAFTQDWTDTALITIDDDWSGVSSIIGYRGDTLTSATGVDPQTVVADGTSSPVDVNAGQTNPNTFNTGGVAEFELSNPVVALNGSGTADAPFLLIHLNTTGVTNINVSYKLRDLDGSVDNAIVPVALQYRIGTSGNFINIPAAFVADASTGPNLADLVTTVNAVLPIAAENQSQVQLRIITTNAVGNDEWIGIDDINISSAASTSANVQITEYMYSGGNEEFIEFTNLGSNPVDMTGWSFDDDSRTPGTVALSAFGIVQPGESVILAESADSAFRAAWGLSDTVKLIGGLTANLGREDEINLFDNSNQLIDRLTYGDQRFPGTVRTQNLSAWTEVENLTSTDISAAWQLSTVGDAQNSYTSTGGDVGNPGVYITSSAPTPGVIITQSDGSTNIAEGGATDTYTVILRSQPSANVTINITPDSQATTSVTTLTFTPVNWNVDQTVTVTAVDDAIIESNHSSTITLTTTSTDASYNGINIPTITASISDNDFGSLRKIGGFIGNGAEITAYDPVSQRLFVVDGTANVQILNFSDPTNPTLFSPIDLSAYGISANSVAVKNGLVAIAIEAANGVDPGKVVFYDTAGTFINDVTVGVLPDMVTFSPDGTKVLTANEGQRSGSADPIGSVSIIDVSQGAATATVATASFTSFDGQEDVLRSQGVRISPGKTVSLDAEPEYITFSKDGTQAWVTLQENNAIAVVDVATATVTQILPLGVVNHSLLGNELDASDRDGAINIRNWPVFGLFMPDAIASFAANGRTYYVTANEGDTRDDDARVSTLNLDVTQFPDAATLKQPNNLGRLTVSTIDGDIDSDGDYDQLFAYGTRSFSIWDDQGNLVYDSGSAFEKITAQQVPSLFNSDGEATNSFDTRSDNKGPEPEGVTIAVINNRTYAFIGLERVGGVMVYEVTNPEKPQFIEYSPAQPGDFAPEGLIFIAANDSPNGKNLLVVSNEVSKTVTVYEVNLPTRISDIQGTAHRSPLEGQQVTDVAGIVTAVRSNGFYLQDPNPDANDATSEGIFVFTRSAPTVAIGDSVQVSGTVTEFRPGNNANNLSTTQITSPTIVKLSSGNALPSATILGNGGRVIPNQVINNDAVGGNVENPGTLFDPAEDGIDFYESLEGMLVQVNNPVAVSPTNSFGEIWVLADNGANATGRTARGGIVISANDFNPERIQIDEALLTSGSPDVNVGATFDTITGVVDYNFNNYEVLPTSLTVTSAGSLSREVTNLTPTTNQLTVATFNVENLDPSDGAVQFNNIAGRIVNNLKSPDIISLEEIQDNNGPKNDSVVDANITYQTLIDAIIAAGGPTYEYRQINPVDDTNGGEPGGNIRVGFLFNPNRVSFVDIAGGTSTSNTTVTNVNGVPTLSGSPGLIDPTNSAFTNSRKPLVGEFTFNGQTVFVVANHFNSKGGDQPLFGPNQPPNLSSEIQRQQQATVVKNFVQSVLAINPNANVAVVGDLNDFEFSNPLSTLESGGLNTLIETLPENERYTYNFQGNAQTLDHILVTNNLLNNLDGYDVVHINSEFYDQDSDHDPSVARFNLPVNLINGTPGRDNLVGSSGNDIITGYQGADNLTGGAGSDQFVYTSLRDGRDTIADFTPGIDKIVFTQLFQSLNLDSLNYATATAQGYLGFSTQANNTNILIDQDGAAGLTYRAVPLISAQGVSQAALANSANFVF
ncbi:choice-of-anchor I family protein [Nostoc sp. WHI]|uniref:choice-of-anchor I family protein n=2 Tax=Nostoc sp. WHI TaxID=2650611 RepID=UPI0018C51FDA|nr:choice-of-anchor I family protein [Nostoc sp. WHI]